VSVFEQALSPTKAVKLIVVIKSLIEAGNMDVIILSANNFAVTLSRTCDEGKS
jgi:CRISPR/Cas system-associated endoribonuclease Cas2